MLLHEMASLLPQSERTQLADDKDTEYQLLQECQGDHLTDTSAYYNNSGHTPEVRKLKVSNVWWWLGRGGRFTVGAIEHHTIHFHLIKQSNIP